MAPLQHFGLEFKINAEAFNKITHLISPPSEYKMVRQTYLDSSGNFTDNPDKIRDFFYGRMDFYCVDKPQSISFEFFHPTESSQTQEIIGRLYFDNYNPVELFSVTPHATYQDLIDLIKESLEKGGATDLRELKIFPRSWAEVIPFPKR